MLLLACCAAFAAHAQTANAPPGEAPGHATQRIEAIRVEDGGSRVDELRAGGQTQSITVQPKTAGAAYDVKPADAHSPLPPPAEAGPGSTGPRTWKVLKF
jgi:hypothetical protein